MKIAILSDFHLGYERFYDDAYLQAAEALKKASEVADALIIPGDLFDNRSPKPEVLAQGIKLFKELKNKEWGARVVSYEGPRKIFTDLPIIAIPGTHERRSEGAENAVELLNLVGLLVNVSEARVIIQKGEEKVAIYGIGGVSEEKFRNSLKEKDPRPYDSIFNIFVFHQSIYDLMPFNKDFISFDELPEGFDLYIDGHIHSRVERTVHSKPFLIPGSTVLTQLKEDEVASKGFFLFDTEAKKYKFIEINSRKFFVIKIDITGKPPSKVVEDAEAEVKKIINTVERPIIRIILTGRYEKGFAQGDFGLLALQKKFSDKAEIEIGRNIEDEEAKSEIDALRNREIENISIRDFGISIFLEKLKENKYQLEANPSELFEILSSEKNKEKAIHKALSDLFKN